VDSLGIGLGVLVIMWGNDDRDACSKNLWGTMYITDPRRKKLDIFDRVLGAALSAYVYRNYGHLNLRDGHTNHFC
jgi:hypothetical protein